MGTNHGNHGKKGRSGRKSLKDELAAYHVAQEILLKKWDLEEIDKIVVKLKTRKGRLSVREVMIVKALGGNETIIKAVWDKFAPTKLQHSGKVPVSEVLDDEEKEDDEQHQPDGAGENGSETPDNRGQAGQEGQVSTEPNPATVQPSAQ